jgi:hypothetical protein
MGQILWSDRAATALRCLAPSSRAAVEKRIGYLQSMPRMYAVAGDDRFPGCRSFWAEAAYCVYYMVAAGGSDCYIVDIVDAEGEEQVGA